MKKRIFNYCLAIALPLILFLLVGFNRVISHFPAYDDAYNATVAKNLASGFGYASSFDSLILFNPEVTTGPSLILPAAILIRVFGATYWVPAFSSFIISFLLFLFITRIFLEYLKEFSIFSVNPKNGYINFALSIILLCLFWISEVMGIEFIGEFSSALLVCSGTLVIFLPHVKNKNIFLGGCLLGLSITTKLVALNLVVPMFVIWGVFSFFDGKRNGDIIRKSSKILILGLGIALPSLLFESYKLFSLGINEYHNLKLRELVFLKQSGSGISEILASANVLYFLINNFQKNLLALQSVSDGIFKLYAYLASFLLFLVRCLFKLIKRNRLSFSDRLALGLGLSVLAYMLWWLFINPLGWYRHVSPAIDVASITIIISVFALFEKKALPAIVVILLFWIFFSPLQWASTLNVPRIPKNFIYSTESTSKYLSGLKSEGKELLGCGWWANRRLEYFMPSILNFKQCYSSQFKNAILVIDSDFWDWEKSEATRNIEQRCSQLIYDNPPYRVYQCK